jgi:hypothetical protein
LSWFDAIGKNGDAATTLGDNCEETVGIPKQRTNAVPCALQPELLKPLVDFLNWAQFRISIVELIQSCAFPQCH